MVYNKLEQTNTKEVLLMFSIQQIANVWVNFFNESLQNILSQEVSLVQLSQNLEQLVNQTGGEVLKAILEQADAAIYATVKPEHRYQVKAHRFTKP